MEQRGKRLYEMTVKELDAEARRYEAAGEAGAYWAKLCREQINLNYAVADAFRRSCEESSPDSANPSL